MNWSCTVTQQSVAIQLPVIDEEDLNNTGPPTVVKKGITEIFPSSESCNDIILGFPLASRSTQPTRGKNTSSFARHVKSWNFNPRFVGSWTKKRGSERT
jgi:hypothetical protein